MTILMWICKFFNYIYFLANFLVPTATFMDIESKNYPYSWIGINNVTNFIDDWQHAPF